MSLRDNNYDCFYGLMSQNIKEYLPIIYTPYVEASMSMNVVSLSNLIFLLHFSAEKKLIFMCIQDSR